MLLVNTVTSYCRALSLGQVSFELTSRGHVTLASVSCVDGNLISLPTRNKKQPFCYDTVTILPNPRVMHACETWRTCGTIGFGNGNNGHSACMRC